MITVPHHGEATAPLRVAPTLGIDPAAEGDEAVVRLTGEVDIATAPQLAASLAALRRGGARHVVLDLTALTFLDARGISVIVDHHARAASAGGTLRIVGARGSVRRILDAVAIDPRITLDHAPR